MTYALLQKLKFARKLLKNVEFDDMDHSPCVLLLFSEVTFFCFANTLFFSSTRIKQLNDSKIKLDRIEVFLKDCEEV